MPLQTGDQRVLAEGIHRDHHGGTAHRGHASRCFHVGARRSVSKQDEKPPCLQFQAGGLTGGGQFEGRGGGEAQDVARGQVKSGASIRACAQDGRIRQRHACLWDEIRIGGKFRSCHALDLAQDGDGGRRVARAGGEQQGQSQRRRLGFRPPPKRGFTAGSVRN